MKKLLLALFVFAASPSLWAGEPPMKINVADRRAETRAALLKFTPLGTDSAEVLAFVKAHLVKSGETPPAIQNIPARGASAEASQKRGVKRLKVDLGDYPNPSLLLVSPLFPFEQSLTAQWAFDEKDRLVELFLDRELKR